MSKFWLEDIDVDEIALVGEGEQPANARNILIWKSEGGKAVNLDDLKKKLDENPVLAKFLNNEQLSDAEIQELASRLPAELRATPDSTEDASSVEKKDDSQSLPFLPIKKSNGEWDYSHIPDDARPYVHAMHQDQLAKDELLEKTVKSLSEEREARISKAYLEEAEQFQSIAKTDLEDTAKALRIADEQSKGTGELLRAVLKRADNAVLESRAFDVVRGGRTEDTSVLDKVMSAANEMVQKSAGAIDLNDAIDQVLTTNTDLAKQYRVERDRLAFGR